MHWRWLASGWLFVAFFTPKVLAQREPVLKQIDLPHAYYFREMYLPQLTSGPSAVTWLPDSQSVVYSMQGSLWRQKLGSSLAVQLTAGPGYDYQPDVSRDGRWLVYAKYDQDAIELWALEMATGKSTQLTSGGAVNLEPRWSPDGARLAFVSTQYNRRFHIFVAAFDAARGRLAAPVRVTGETRSPLPRYYYSQFDHEISPAWAPDGQEIIYISNRGHIHGSGGFWRAHLSPDGAASDAREIRYEETTWKAKPEWAPDGKRVVYSSYLGRQWHQLWLMTSSGGDVFPLTYGEYDNTSPRWSPDGSKIAFISNRHGELSLHVRDVVSGAESELAIAQKKTLQPTGTLALAISDELQPGAFTPARVSVVAADGRSYGPVQGSPESWMHADDSFVRSESRFEFHYFHTGGQVEFSVPAGRATVEVMKGLEYRPVHREVEVRPGEKTRLAIALQPLAFKNEDPGRLWVSGDVHLHMNYAGTYQATPATLVRQMQAENLGVAHNLIVNKEQRFPDVQYASRLGKLDAASRPEALLLQGQEFHTSYWGHLGLLNLSRNLVVPGYAAYPNTAAASIYPMNATVADAAHKQNHALVGYVHPFDAVPNPATDAQLTAELPVDVALGKVDYYEVLGFSDHKSSAAVWYKLLDLGFRIPAAAGTDAMTNYASLRGPVGLNRVYAQVPRAPAPPELKLTQWLQALQQGRTFATNGPLLRFSLEGKPPGEELTLDSATAVRFRAALRSIVPVDHFEVVCNGEPVATLALNPGKDSADVSGTVKISRSGWCLLRAWAEKAEHPILDIYPYATTSPVYVTVAHLPPSSRADAQYFVAWIDRLLQAASAHADYNSAREKEEVLKTLQAARAIYAAKATPAAP